MVNEIKEPNTKSREKKDHTPTLETLIEKHNLQGIIPNKERIFRAYNLAAERYQLTEDFLKDEVNQTLLLGICQKYMESSDPIFRDRLKRYFRILVAPSMGKERFDFDLSKDLSTGGDRSKRDAFLEKNINQEAIAEFIRTYQDSLEKSKQEWLKRGYNLDFEIKIINEDEQKFLQMVGGTGFISAPDLSKLESGEEKPKIQIVFLNGKFNPSIVRHELYHIQDYFNFIRRGAGAEILEGLDEIHTEYSVERFKKNINEEVDDEKAEGYYSNYKIFWRTLIDLADLDFDLIKDRTKTLDVITEKFGLEGTLIFSLQDPRYTGSQEKLKIFYAENLRSIVEMLIAKQKVSLRKESQESNLDEALKEIPKLLEDLIVTMSPNKNDWPLKYSSIYDLIKVNIINHPEQDNTQIKKLIDAYFKAIALTEIYSQKEGVNEPEKYQEILALLDKIPYQRKNPNYNLESYLNTNIELALKYVYPGDQESSLEEVYGKIIFNLVEDINGINFAFSLSNTTTKEKMFRNFFKELDLIAQNTIANQNQNVRKYLIRGIFNYTGIDYETRETILNYLRDRYPELREIIENI